MSKPLLSNARTDSNRFFECCAASCLLESNISRVCFFLSTAQPAAELSQACMYPSQVAQVLLGTVGGLVGVGVIVLVTCQVPMASAETKSIR